MPIQRSSNPAEDVATRTALESLQTALQLTQDRLDALIQRRTEQQAQADTPNSTPPRHSTTPPLERKRYQ